MRRQIIDFFESLKKQIEDMQKSKLDEFNKLFKEANIINIKTKAKELSMRADLYEKFLVNKKNEFEGKNYVNYLS